MVKFKTRTGKFLMAALLAAACMAASAPAAYADGPSGPASDTEISGHKDTATGPGAGSQGTDGGQTGGQIGTGAVEGQTGAGAVEGQAGAGAVEGQTSAGAAEEQAAAGSQQEGQTGQTAGAAEGQTTAGSQTTAESQTTAGGQQEAQTGSQAGQEAELPAEQPVQTDGLVFSGGRYIDPTKPMIALTVDDGPYAPVGNRIMDRLEQYNGRATFFVVGNRVASYKTEILRMQNSGHEVANHTYDHKYLTKLGAAEIRSQIDRCNQAVAAVTGVSPTLVRLPGGLKNNTVLANVDFPMIMWNIDTMDWKTRNAQKTIAAVVGNVQDGDVVLMHELYTATADAVDTIVPALAEQGYQFVTVSELAQFRGGVQAGALYKKFRP